MGTVRLLLGIMLLPTFAVAGPMPPNRVAVQLFEWPWTSIGAECPRLKADGIDYVQVSPPNEHAPLPGAPWYDRYQPVSYRIGNRSGDEAAFQAMVAACNQAGVGVLVDAVLNHMAIIPPEGVRREGNLGSEYWRYSFPGLYAYWDFHRCNYHPPDDHIYNYNDRREVQLCNLAGLADLATGAAYVRQTLAKYLRRLLNVGVAGFRIDAAKHMPAQDIAEILKQAGAEGAVIIQEVIGSPSEPIKPGEYTGNGGVTEFGFAHMVGRAFRDGNLRGLSGNLNRLQLPLHRAVTFVDNHDTQRGHGAGQSALTYKQRRRYELANAFMLAWPYGNPVLMSSYHFNSDQDGPPLGDKGLIQDVPERCDASLWVCEHRWPMMRKTARWRAEVGDAPGIVVAEDTHEIAVSREGRGFFAVNLSRDPARKIYRSQMARGSYCNALADVPPTGICPDEDIVYVHEDGSLIANLRAEGAMAIGPRDRFNPYYP